MNCQFVLTFISLDLFAVLGIFCIDKTAVYSLLKFQ